MGGVFSCGEDNDDLINILILLGYIRSKKVERVFRAVDRGDYVCPSHRELAYKDLSWKLGNIHLSAPCVYCKVMEGLTLKPGLSFLNIGSGTGYLSTMAGLILGKNGTNHGIEMHEDCLMYAYEHLDVFKKKSLDVDSFEFCEPVFKLGNILNATPNRQYDRVYCGAACPENHEQYIKQFVKVGGILVMPYKENLLRIERLDENTWRNSTMLPVSFASLVTPQEDNERGLLQLPLWQPVSLQEMCRSSIRCHLRKLVWSEHNDLEYKAPIKAQPIERSIPHLHLGIPFSEEPNRGQSTSDSSEAGDYESDEIPADDRASPLLYSQAHSREVVSSTLQFVRAVVQLNQIDEDDDDRSEATTSDDSEPIPAVPEPENPPKPAESPENPAWDNFFELKYDAPSDDDDFMEAESAETEENAQTRGPPEATEIRRPPDSKLKRKCETSGEPHSSQRYRRIGEANAPESSGDRAAPTTSSPDQPASIASPEDPENDELLNIAWIEHAFSILKDKLEMEQNSSDSSDASDTPESLSEDSASIDPLESSSARADRENSDRERPRTTRDNDDPRGSLFLRLFDSKPDDAHREAASDSSEARENDSRPFLDDAAALSDENRRKTGDLEREDDDEDAKMPDKSDSSSDLSSDDEPDRRTKFLRSAPRARSGAKVRARARSDTSASNESSGNNTYGSDWSDSTDPDPDFDFNLIHQRSSLRRNPYAHTIRKEHISRFMQRKVDGLPLPLPLRLYLNYNREL